MKRSAFKVDFNELLEPNLVLLSVGDICNDSNGTPVSLYEGLEVAVFEDDTYEDDDCKNYLVANGVVEKNKGIYSWCAHVKWCCRIDSDDIKHQSSF